MTLEEKVDRLLENVETYCDTVNILKSNLYGNPDMPGMDGDIQEIKEHLKSHNNFASRLARVEATVKVILLLFLGGGGAYGLERAFG